MKSNVKIRQMKSTNLHTEKALSYLLLMLILNSKTVIIPFEAELQIVQLF